MQKYVHNTHTHIPICTICTYILTCMHTWTRQSCQKPNYTLFFCRTATVSFVYLSSFLHHRRDMCVCVCVFVCVCVCICVQLDLDLAERAQMYLCMCMYCGRLVCMYVSAMLSACMCMCVCLVATLTRRAVRAGCPVTWHSYACMFTCMYAVNIPDMSGRQFLAPVLYTSSEYTAVWLFLRAPV
jgi:hypothetical protein